MESYAKILAILCYYYWKSVGRCCQKHLNAVLKCDTFFMGVLLESYAKTVVANFVLLLLEKHKNLMQISLIRYNYTVMPTI